MKVIVENGLYAYIYDIDRPNLGGLQFKFHEILASTTEKKSTRQKIRSFCV